MVMYCEPVTTMQECFDMNEMIEDMLIQVENDKIRHDDLNSLIKSISGFYGVDPALLQENTNKREVVEPRQVVHYYARLLTKLSTSEIGRKVGGRDHSTVLHSIRTIDNLIATNKAFQRKIKDINLLLGIN